MPIALGLAVGLSPLPAVETVPDKTVVLTFDDSVKSHRTFVGPFIKEFGFGATFFITQAWMNDPENFMSWEDVAELYQMGFEIGNHTWTHGGLNKPEADLALPEELSKVEEQLARVGVPQPISFAWPGNAFGPEARAILKKKCYQFARRGMQPELPYGQIRLGPLYDPAKYDPLLIPTSGDAYPQWILDHFKKVVDRAKGGEIVVLQFHGVPDIVHPWVDTSPERFREYMGYLKDNGFHVIALRDVGKYIDPEREVADSTVTARYPQEKGAN
jgi:peptidoglycan/xylan/chitin deacetylase (PgdA/CDA1 family)